MSSSIACIAFNNGKIFIAKRINKGDMANRWEFPGGKIDPGENCEIAIKREMQEEFGVDVTIGEQLASTSFIHKEKTCTVTAFRITFAHDGIEKPFTLTEHTEYKWVYPDEINKLDFVDSDLKLLPEVLKKL